MLRKIALNVVVTLLVTAVVVPPVVAQFADLYQGSFVEDVDPSNFNEKVIEHTGVVLLQFYTTWSPNCKKLAPKWVEAAEVLKSEGSSVRIAKFDADTHREFARRFKLEGYPTLASFGKYTKELPTYELSAEVSVDEIVDHAKQLDSVTQDEADEVMKEVRKTKKKGSAKQKKKSEIADDDSSSSSGTETKKSSKKKKSKSSKKDKKEHSRSSTPSPGKKRSHKQKKSPPSPTEEKEPHAHPSPKFDMPHPPPPPSQPDTFHSDVGADRGAERHHRRHRSPIIDPIKPHDILGAGAAAGAAGVPPLGGRHHIPHPPLHGGLDNKEWEERRKHIPPRSPDDDAKHEKLVQEHWERVRQRKEEREERRTRGESNEHDDMYFKHEQMSDGWSSTKNERPPARHGSSIEL
ncbi:protein disulfide isomerase, putative [Bodo saltans]|uniref:Protein disulfide isomerase, putative n=1 Tax=Bodo saltans TaxID=75058 RepID=A0A0S4JA54_BODSA|nr:protein disulfide isomerase, putative [Bodo saltans]|eukprot:CUG86861.1 protein disulfide isomerase, putative [Bodo saltans]